MRRLILGEIAGFGNQNQIQLELTALPARQSRAFLRHVPWDLWKRAALEKILPK